MTDPHRRRIDQILDPGYLEDIENIPLDALRAKRLMCDEVDTELSYYRRLLHGRMDLLAFELRRRRGEETRTLLEALPEIIAGAERSGGTSGRAMPVDVPDVPFPHLNESKGSIQARVFRFWLETTSPAARMSWACGGAAALAAVLMLIL